MNRSSIIVSTSSLDPAAVASHSLHAMCITKEAFPEARRVQKRWRASASALPPLPLALFNRDHDSPWKEWTKLDTGREMDRGGTGSLACHLPRARHTYPRLQESSAGE